MPSPTNTVPSSHRITVNLDQVLTTLDQAIERTSYHTTYPALPFKTKPPMDPSSSQVSTIEELRSVLKPALTSPPPSYYKRWHDGQWVHILKYVTPRDEDQYILLYPTHIVVDETDTEYIIDQSLAYYFSLALDPTAEFTAINYEDAHMIGALRCFGRGKRKCLNYDAFMPPVPNTYPDNRQLPPYSVWYDSFKHAFLGPQLAQKHGHPKLRLLYLDRAARGALALASAVHHINSDNATVAKPVSDLIQQFTPQFRTKTNYEFEDTYQSQIDHLKPGIAQFLEALFKTNAWQHSYRHFRNYFFNLGCQETSDDANDLYRIDCTQYGIWFSAHKVF